MGLCQAGFDIEGVDINPQPHYPFKFYQADALSFNLSGYDAYWASPPCQKFSVANKIHGDRGYCDLIEPIRERLQATGKPFVIENVRGAPLRNKMMLCGTMFGLQIRRHRYFECSFPIYFAPASCSCKGKFGYTNASRGQSSFKKGARLICVAGHNFILKEAQIAMGIDWMNQDEIAEAIPPAYSEYLGKYMAEALNDGNN